MNVRPIALIAGFWLFLLGALLSAARSMAGDEEAVRIDVGGGVMLNSVLLRPHKTVDLPPVLFIHGASASLYDPMYSFRDKLEGRAALLFVDRPGHGDSDVGGPENILPDGQADAIASLMERRGIRKAIVVSHSFGGAIAAALAVRHPDRVVGLVFLSPAVYPWKGGIAWYYDAAAVPVTGALFSSLIAPPIGLLAIRSATSATFSPNRMPQDYIREARTLQVLRPGTFRHNAQEVAALNGWARTASRGYRKIRVPTVIITGDADSIVSPVVHARHLARDIRGARLFVVRNLGHKSDYVARDLAIAAIESVGGRRVDLNAEARTIELRIAADDER
ncbi:MAG TPA: alpha/beta hydrolase [Ensifer sp.]|uniref:alpha/beta fold hydrolase n=1 Tax=Ensifer sp. TaxID=1872086 RepID=UPI002E162D6F|nr:alpha/beta hydrolase [Ensifer sp.]